MREGDLEIKQLARSRELTDLVNMFGGRAEHWQKWGWQYVDADDNFHKQFDKLVVAGFQKKTKEAFWIEVDKNRRRRRFAFTDSGELSPATGRVSTGVLAEVTALKVAGQPWWTVACEVVGDLEHPFDGLETGNTPASPQAKD